MTESITILRPSYTEDVDEQGEPTNGADAQILSPGWAVAPLTADEDSVATGSDLIEGYTLYQRDQVIDIRSDDRVVVRGNVFGVVSSTSAWVHPTTGMQGTAVRVRRAV